MSCATPELPPRSTAGPPWAPRYAHMTRTPALAFATRVELEDFQVEELPLVEPAGSGTHVWFQIEKRGVATDAAARRIARRLGVAPRSIGWAGRKDARAVARQWLSVEHVDPERVRALALPGLRVLRVERAERKLKIGALRGNRFRIVLRGLALAAEVAPDAIAGDGADAGARAALEAGLAELERRGVPNYVGAQRFGWNGRAHELGAALVARDHERYVAALVDPEHALRPEPARPGERRDELRAALRALGNALAVPAAAPPLERELVQHALCALAPELAGLVRAIGRGEREPAALAACVPRRLARLHVAAFASRVFNDVLAERVASPLGCDALEAGDVAFLHANGASFVVEPNEVAAANARAAAFELSPSGPEGGKRLLEGAGAPREREERAFAAHGVSAADLGRIGLGLDRRGSRRPLRMRLESLSVSEAESGVVLEFRLPAGGFATTVLEELAKRWRPAFG